VILLLLSVSVLLDMSAVLKGAAAVMAALAPSKAVGRKELPSEWELQKNPPLGGWLVER